MPESNQNISGNYSAHCEGESDVNIFHQFMVFGMRCGAVSGGNLNDQSIIIGLPATELQSYPNTGSAMRPAAYITTFPAWTALRLTVLTLSGKGEAECVSIICFGSVNLRCLYGQS
ncbi:MAG: hypothetical protein E6868_02945 [Pantoea sp.]|uniref:hypothetical protein n=1 Tax=Pantoea sp. TaxID=69393 RepID=UPI0029016F84|nr:hypothetical protein [Pantoea sp.]MDU1572185.1 hypothetical protein [Pantoea sp.]